MRIVLLSFTLLMLPRYAQAGAWVQDPGAHYAKVWTRGLIGNGVYLASGDRDTTDPSYLDVNLNGYFEYGLLENLTIVGFGSPAGYANATRSVFYVGDLAGGARFGILRGPIHLAFEGHYGYAGAVGEEDILDGGGSPAGVVYVPVVETHHVDGEVQLGTGWGRHWVTSHAGFRFLTASQLDHVLYGMAQYGYAFENGVTFDVHVSLNYPLGFVTLTNVSGAGQTRYVGFGFGLSYALSDQWALLAGIDGAAYAASNAATPALVLGFEHRSDRD